MIFIEKGVFGNYDSMWPFCVSFNWRKIAKPLIEERISPQKSAFFLHPSLFLMGLVNPHLSRAPLAKKV